MGEFSAAWKSWWESIQPLWRQQYSWPLSRDVPAHSDWEVLCRGGVNNIFLIVMCLSWWAPLALSAKEQEAFDKARDDVVWVFESLLGYLIKGPGNVSTSKHTAEESKDPTPTPKCHCH